MSILKKAESLQTELIKHRSFLHSNPELDLDLDKTRNYVYDNLKSMGIDPTIIGKSGLTALIGNGNGPTVLLRADMDALPVLEEADVECKSTNGSMHACGHDIHTTMLLGAAKLLKEKESEINGYVKLMFQPGEETLNGARDMIDNGILENPKVDGAMMIHVLTGMPITTGAVLIPEPGAVSASSDSFDIQINGRGGHGAMPDFTVDPLNIASHLHIALQAIVSREVAPADPVAVTIGSISGGVANNVIPDKAYLKGTVRTFDNKTRDFIENRIIELSNGTASLFRGSAEVNYKKGCPSVISDTDVTDIMKNTVADLLGEERIISFQDIMQGGKMMGSEDFAFVTQKVPSVMISYVTGDAREGYNYPLHHPKAKFDVSKIYEGSAIYAQFALNYLKSNSK